ncbi:MAG: IS66 family insertion sequence element accessory protein TnpB [Oligoflexia bacterium]|nr:IS66 family insertion sequence element accessory protein TnpB [Oligoflexia bacterium]
MIPFEIPYKRKILMYTKPINMRLGDIKLIQLCKDDIGIDPADQKHVFLFFNKTKDQLRILLVDDVGVEMVTKLLDKGAFMVLLPDDDETKTIEISHSLLPKLFK